MIHATFKENKIKGTMRLTLAGHAQSAPFGEDLICAGASMLAYTMAQNAVFAYEDGLLRRKPKIVSRDGYREVIVTPKFKHYKEVRTMFITIVHGLLTLQHNFRAQMHVDGVYRDRESRRVDIDLE